MKKHIKLISALVTLAIIFLLGLLSIEFLGEYGWTVLVLIPFLIGFLPPFISGYQTDLSRKNCYLLSFYTLGGAILSLLVFALEGMICIVMASPILILLTRLYLEIFCMQLTLSFSDTLLLFFAPYRRVCSSK